MTRTSRRALAATLVAAAAGAASGTAIGGESTPPRAEPPAPRVGLTSGAARLTLPDGWRPLRRYSSLPGLDSATEVRAPHSTVALDIRPPENSLLLPASVVAQLDDAAPSPRPTRVDRRAAWRFELRAAAPGLRALALTLPTTGGVVTIACQAPAAEQRMAERECSQAMAAMRLQDATALPPTPEAAARIVLPGAFAALNRRRAAARRRLGTRSPSRRSAVARDLAQAYADAASALRPVAGGAAVPVTATLDGLARAHRALATASRRRQGRSGRRASRAIARGERRLAAQLAALDDRE